MAPSASFHGPRYWSARQRVTTGRVTNPSASSGWRWPPGSAAGWRHAAAHRSTSYPPAPMRRTEASPIGRGRRCARASQDLGEPGHAFEEVLDLLARAVLRGAGHHHGEIGHEEADARRVPNGAGARRRPRDLRFASAARHRRSSSLWAITRCIARFEGRSRIAGLLPLGFGLRERSHRTLNEHRVSRALAWWLNRVVPQPQLVGELTQQSETLCINRRRGVS